MKEAGRAHPFDPRHDAFHELNTTAMLLREIVQPLGLSAGLPCSEMRLMQMLHALVGNINDAV